MGNDPQQEGQHLQQNAIRSGCDSVKKFSLHVLLRLVQNALFHADTNQNCCKVVLQWTDEKI